MKHCAKCGKELPDEAVVCPGCGCAVTPEQGTQKKKSHLKLILIIAIAAVLVAGAVVGGIFLRNHLRIEKVKDQLAGKVFSYSWPTDYTFSQWQYAFDDNAECIVTYEDTYYDTNGAIYDVQSGTYTQWYDIEFEDGKTYLKMGGTVFEIQYNEDGDVVCLYHVNKKAKYRRTLV